MSNNNLGHRIGLLSLAAADFLTLKGSRARNLRGLPLRSLRLGARENQAMKPNEITAQVLNFGLEKLKDGIVRIVNGLPEDGNYSRRGAESAEVRQGGTLQSPITPL